MSEKPFRVPGSPEFSAPVAHTKKPEQAKGETKEEYEHPMKAKLKDARAAEEEKKTSLIDKLKKKFGIPTEKKKRTLEMTDMKTGKKVEAEIVEDEQNGKDQAA